MSGFGVHTSDCLCPECWGDSREREAHQPQPLPLKVSQKARDAAADHFKRSPYPSVQFYAEEVRAGRKDDDSALLALARFERDLTAPSGEGDVDPWLVQQLLAWPRRVDPEKTTNIEYLMKTAAAALASTATKLAEVERELHKETELRKMAEQVGDARASRLAQAVAALTECDAAIKEMFRYYHGGETRGSYDGKPERNQLRKAGYVATVALTSLKGAPDAQ